MTLVSPLMYKVESPECKRVKELPIYIGGAYKGGLSGGREPGQFVGSIQIYQDALGSETREYLTVRKPGTLFMNTPCQNHISCPGFAVSSEVIKKISELKAVTIRVLYITKEKEEAFICNVERLKKDGAKIWDNNTVTEQRALPMHDWMSLGERRLTA